MFDNNMATYVDGKFENLQRFYVLALEQNDPEGIHDLRVELKYLKAFFRLVDAINPAFAARKKFRNFRNIARTTCGLRDSQVQIKLLEKMGADTGIDVTGFRLFLQKQEHDYRNRFIGFSSSKPLRKLEKKGADIKKALHAIDHARAEMRARGRFYNLRNRLIFLHREDTLKDEILHTVRKLAKETHYTLEIIRSSFDILRDSDDFIAKISSAHKLLGKWHDFEVCRRFLGEYRDTNPPDASETLNGLADSITAAKETIRKDIGTAFDEFSKIAETM